MLTLGENSTRYLPTAPTVVAFTSSSSAFTAINTTPSDRWYVVVATADCYVKRGPTGIGAATTADFLVQTGTHDFMLKPGDGVRVIRASADGTLQIGDTAV